MSWARSAEGFGCTWHRGRYASWPFIAPNTAIWLQASDSPGRSAESLALQTRLSAGAGLASHVHVGKGERPLVGELGDPFVGRPVAVRALRLDSDQDRLVAPLRLLHRRRELERVARHDA